MRRSPLFLALFAAALSLGACRTMPAAEGGTAAADTPAATATVPADDNLNAVLWLSLIHI